jgi:hypothetical protein
LLRGEIRSGDFSALCLYLRSHSYGCETVRELGDFVAHADERYKGITTQRVKDFFTFLRFRIPTLKAAIDLGALPLNFASVLEGSFRYIDDATIKRVTRLKRKTAHKVLQSVIDSLVPNGSGGLTITRTSSDEIAIIHCCIGRITTGPAFNEDRLFNEFVHILGKNNLLHSDERAAFQAVRASLILFAVSSMHLCRIDLGDGTEANLSASPDAEAGKMGISASATVHDAMGRPIIIQTPIFLTTLDGAIHCEQSLAATNQWNFAVELSPCGKLVKLA